MGVCSSRLSHEDAMARNKSKHIERMTRNMVKEESRARKLLLLGSGESGKSTLFKQAQILYSGGFDQNDRIGFRQVITLNILEGIMKLIKSLDPLFFEQEPSLKSSRDFVLDIHDRFLLPDIVSPIMAEHVSRLWALEEVKQKYALHRNELQVQDNVNVFLDKVCEMCEEDWMPSDQDILYSRRATTGATEMVFKMKGSEGRIKLVDVGGQRSERRKWVHQFAQCSAILFVAAISEFDQFVYEDEETNRLNESLVLFDEICNNQWFDEKDLILFLNKRDILKAKLKQGKELKTYFPAFEGGCEFKKVVKFLILEFAKRNKNPKRGIYTHVTCATDTNNIQNVFADIQDIILSAALDTLI